MIESSLGRIEIKGLRLFGFHGVMPQETEVGNTFEIDLCVDFPALSAMRTDRIDRTINYAEIVEVIKFEMTVPSKLIEHLAFRIVRAIVQRFPQIVGGRIAVYKLQPPISAEMDRVGFVYSW